MRAGRATPIAVLLAACLAAALLPAAAAADRVSGPEYYAGRYFNPQLGVSASTTQAGAHPDIQIAFQREKSQCPGQKFGPFDYSFCSPDEVHIEQNLKDMVTHMPAGLLADVNAAPQCDLRGWPKVANYSDTARDFLACPPESQVGVVHVPDWPLACTAEDEEGQSATKLEYMCSAGYYGIRAVAIAGYIFNGVAEPGEQAHLYALFGYCDNKRTGQSVNYPDTCDPAKFTVEDAYLLQRVDIGVRLRTESDWGLDASASDIPEAMCLSPFDPQFPDSTGCVPEGNAAGWIPTPIDEFVMTLFGHVGTDRSRPFTQNPTSCQRRTLSADFRGYAQNAWWDVFKYWAGSGDGLTAQGSDSYPVTGCNSLPYDPKLSLSLDPAGPAQPAAITSTVTQAVGEQTTKHVEVRLPRSFKVNFQNSLAQCSADQAAARSCPGEAKVGEVVAESNLLPETGDFAGPLRGEVFIGETTATDIRLYVLLHGFVEATLQGSLTMNADGSSQVSFDLPEVPQQEITLSFLGGKDKGLVTTPKTCGTHTLDATFTSHQGTVRTLQVPVEVSCAAPTFDVGLSTRRPRAHPTLDLSTGSSGLRSVSFDLPAALKVAHRPGRLKVLGSYGALTLEGQGGPSELKLKLLGVGRKGQLSFTGTEAGAELTSLAAKRVSLGGRKRAHGKSSSRPLRLNLGDLPSGTTGVSLELAGKRDGLLQNPSTCRRTRGHGHRPLRLGFTAHIVTTDGQAHTLHQTVAMSCKRSSRGRGR